MSSFLHSMIDSALAQAQENGIEIYVTGAAIVRDEKLLLVTRALSDESFAGHIEIPGGGLEKGETLLEGLAREMKEETGMDIRTIVRFANSFDYTSGSGRRVRQFNFVVEPSQEHVTLDPKEHSAYMWFPVAEPAHRLPTPMTPEMRDAIAEILMLI